MIANPITFERISWAAFVSRFFGRTGPDAYMAIYRDISFRNSLVDNPENVSPKLVCDKLIAGFLNKWRSRFPNNLKSASAILSSLQQLKPLIQATRNMRIENINFDAFINTKARQFEFEASGRSADSLQAAARAIRQTRPCSAASRILSRSK